MIRKQFNPATVTINVKVSPKSFTVKYNPTRPNDYAIKEPEVKTPKHIPDNAANMFDQLAANAKGPLKDTLTRLAQHRKK